MQKTLELKLQRNSNQINDRKKLAVQTGKNF